jgi:two-component system chemotaxis sensor kinase CheA
MIPETGQWSVAELDELKKIFFTASKELTEDLQEALLKFESAPDEEVLKTIKRFVHTLKGDSNSVGLTQVGALCHRMEDVLSGFKAGQAANAAIELLLACTDELSSLLEEGEAGNGGRAAEAVMLRIDDFLRANGQAAPAREPHRPTEYQALQARSAVNEGLRVFRIEARFHRECAERSIAGRLSLARMGELGRMIAVVPDPDDDTMDSAEGFEAMIATNRSEEDLRRAGLVTGLIGEMKVSEYSSAEFGARSSESKADGSSETGGTVSASTAQTDTFPLQSAPAAEMIRVEASRLDRLMNLVGELIIGRSMVSQAASEAGLTGSSETAERLRAVSAYLERTVKDLQASVMRMRMVPLNYVLRKIPRIARDLSLAKKKPVRVEIQGKEIELDKSIVDRLGEPLAHIVRNMVDHGIEDPAERRTAGKPAEGVISIRGYHEAARVVIELSDDGRGIDTEKLKNKAVEKGMLSGADAAVLRDSDAYNLVFLPGLSTADRLTETSGRGVGMDIVKNSVEGMGGSIEIGSTRGKGTKMLLKLPLTRAVIKALLFQAGERTFAIPLSSVAEIARIGNGDVRTVDGMETLLLRERVVSLVRMTRLFLLPEADAERRYALLLNHGNNRVGLLVDRITGQQDLVVKRIEGVFTCSDVVAGASLLGDGKVVVILDAPALIRKAVNDGKKEKNAA